MFILVIQIINLNLRDSSTGNYFFHVLLLASFNCKAFNKRFPFVALNFSDFQQ